MSMNKPQKSEKTSDRKLEGLVSILLLFGAGLYYWRVTEASPLPSSQAVIAASLSPPQQPAVVSELNRADSKTPQVSKLEVQQPQTPLVAPPATKSAVQAALSKSISGLSGVGDPKWQGVWIEDMTPGCGGICRVYLASHNGEVPAPAASLTKILTTEAVLNRYSPDDKALVSGGQLSIIAELWYMNSDSDNEIADSITRILGGAKVIEQTAEQIAGVIPSQLHLVNGSGLPPDQDAFEGNNNESRNLISPKGVCDVYASLVLILQKSNRPIHNAFAIAGKDGTLKNRILPPGTIGKTGTLRDISALAVLVPKGPGSYRCVAIINSTNSVAAARIWQEGLINGVSSNMADEDRVPQKGLVQTLREPGPGEVRL